MKTTIVLGIVFIGLGVVLYYLGGQTLTFPVLYGAFAGIGIGLIFGGIIGYISKGIALKQNSKMQELRKLKAENKEYSKQIQQVDAPSSTAQNTKEAPTDSEL